MRRLSGGGVRRLWFDVRRSEAFVFSLDSREGTRVNYFILSIQTKDGGGGGGGGIRLSFLGCNRRDSS